MIDFYSWYPYVWENGICCPDIQLLPALAEFFGVSVDELMGVNAKSEVTLQNICEEIKTLFGTTPEDEHLPLAFMLSIILHKCAVSKGFKNGCNNWLTDTGEWKSAYENWGASILSEPQGETFYIRNATFFFNHNNWRKAAAADIRNISRIAKIYSDPDVLKVMFAIYELTLHDFDLFVTLDEICRKCGMPERNVQNALERLDVHIKDTENGERYRLHGNLMHIPPMLMILGDKT